MILLDTNVLIYAAQRDAAFSEWAREIIANAVAGEGAAVNAVVLAEYCVGDLKPLDVPGRLRRWGIALLDIPCAAAPVCSAAYNAYRAARAAESGGPIPRMPLPDFFIGAHAQVMGWPVATADRGRFGAYFPSVTLVMPVNP